MILYDYDFKKGFVRLYSDQGYIIIRDDGVEFTEAVERENNVHFYVESDKKPEIFQDPGPLTPNPPEPPETSL